MMCNNTHFTMICQYLMEYDKEENEILEAYGQCH
jgi:hypothetical protein